MQTQTVQPIESRPDPLHAHEAVLQNTLGKWAVARDEEAATLSLRLDDIERNLRVTDSARGVDPDILRYDAEYVASRRGDMLTSRDNFLDKTRAQLGKLNQIEERTLHDYIHQAASPYIYDLYLNGTKGWPDNDDMSDVSWTNWLSHEASDEQLMSFLQWHVDMLAKQQTSENFKDRAQQEKVEFKAELQKGVDEGWLHPGAETAIKRVDGIEVYVGDAFDTLIDNTGGYTVPGTGSVVIAVGSGGDVHKRERSLLENVSQHLKHELNHAVLGKLPYTWINEAVTENIAGVFNGIRAEKRGAYVAERNLLKILLESGPVKVPERLVTFAYSDPDGEKSDSYKIFTRALDTAWDTKDVLGKIEARIAEATQALWVSNPELPYHRVYSMSVKKIATTLQQDSKILFQPDTTSAA